MSAAISPITIFTIGFTGKTAEVFFETLRKAEVRRVMDVRLNNVSQLAGFAKRRDLEYFLRAIAGIGYVHEPLLAPTKDILDAYKKQKRIDWQDYEERFKQLLAARRPAEHLTPGDLDRACLLCSEPTPEQCHRRLVADYFQQQWREVAIKHL